MGNTCGVEPLSCHLPVHPHACGEYGETVVQGRPSNGSSPRVWGIRLADYTPRGSPRFIPTRVGNTRLLEQGPGSSAVHPHACGEYLGGFFAARQIAGSSPRVWGIHPYFGMSSENVRFIPTRVGNTECAVNRVRESNGSSPRVWGILEVQVSRENLQRFIPTRVGNTICARDCRSALPVHPHACGEYPLARVLCSQDYGSSPRVWGILAVTIKHGGGNRFIPTRVGNT